MEIQQFQRHLFIEQLNFDDLIQKFAIEILTVVNYI